MATVENYSIEEAFVDLLGEGIDRDYLRKLLSGLYVNYSRVIIQNALEKEDSIQIPVEAAEELYWLNQLVQILDGNYQFSYSARQLKASKKDENK